MEKTLKLGKTDGRRIGQQGMKWLGGITDSMDMSLSRGGGVGGRGVHLSPQIHQKHTFRHISVCRTPAEGGQEYLTTGKEYIEPHKTHYDEVHRGENRSVSRTGPALGG